MDQRDVCAAGNRQKDGTRWLASQPAGKMTSRRHAVSIRGQPRTRVTIYYYTWPADGAAVECMRHFIGTAAAPRRSWTCWIPLKGVQSRWIITMENNENMPLSRAEIDVHIRSQLHGQLGIRVRTQVIHARNGQVMPSRLMNSLAL